jgi:hypothetical protein
MNQYGLVEPLTNLTINSILKKEVNFIGCFSRENLPVINKLPISFIINTHEIKKTPLSGGGFNFLNLL